MLNKKLMIATSIFFFSSSVFASGSYSGGSSSGNGNFGSTQKAKRVDHAYENGKAIYNGRTGNQVVSYCIVDVNKGNVSSQVKRSTINQLKGASYADVGERLHDCANPKNAMKSLLNKHQLNSVAYYLNKRYKLRLSRS